MKLKQSFYLLVILPLLLFSCQNAQDEQVNEVEEESAATASAFEDAPSWAKEVVWYQIFVERFRNGDKSNDPRPQDIEGSFPGFVPEGWAITPWTQDWYKEDPYFAAMKGTKMPEGYTLDKFEQFLQARRYGGDLQGVLDKVDYLDSLGVTAIYFNPLNDSPSLHKYDPRTWRHVDINFGPSPDKDIATMAQETPDDPSTWQMTGADQLFVDVIKAFHDKGIKVILDYSWNHTGNTFWALKDVQEKGEASKYKDWYIVEEYDDPSTEENEFDYKGWVGIKTLPEIKETVEFHADALAAYEGDFVSEAAKQHVFNITKRWLDPNGDGNPEDGVDGFRLDVAA
ncbi:MAG: alpha-amylase family glycosyl hydrolase, partial [Bacteroidota bacterium]